MKIKSLIAASVAFACLLIAAFSCSKDLDYNTNRRSLDLSTDFQYDFNSKTATLGRVLFYDKALSINNSVSCASCHKQVFAFADNTKGSRGFENFVTDRNTPPIQNLGLFFAFPGPEPGDIGQALFWDGRERILQDMVVQPIFNHIEMGIRNTGNLVRKVEERPYYAALFTEAFGDEQINLERISEALMVFVQNIRSVTSAFDQRLFNGSDQSLTPAQLRGFDLFFGKYNCGSCHQLHAPAGYFVPAEGDEFLNIGLDANYKDKGRGALTKKPEDNGKFKIPNLRNVALTAPYMHDGRFETLSEVIGHYSTGVQSHPNLDSRLKDENGQVLVLNITETEKQDLIAFLHSLTDNGMVTDPRFSDPFIKY